MKALLLLLIMGLALQVSAEVDMNGYLKSFPALISAHDGEGGFTNVLNIHNRGRINLAWYPDEKIQLKLSYELAPTLYYKEIGESQKALYSLPQSPYRIDDLERLLYPGGSPDEIHRTALSQNLDSAAVRIDAGNFTVSIGRQSLGWGVSRLINPTDILSPFAFNAIDKEERIGIDAAIVRIPIGMMHEVETGWLFGKDAEVRNSAAFLRGKFATNIGDFSALAIAFKENLLIGGDFEGAIGGAGVRLELAQVFDSLYSSETNGKRGDYFRLSGGTDYQFNERFYGFVEYHFNGAGKRSELPVGVGTSQTAYTEGMVYLLGRHYVGVGTNIQIHPLVNGSVSLMNSIISDTQLAPSATLSLNSSYNLRQNENISIDAGASIGIGDNEGTKVSEFGISPNFYYLGFRFYY